MGGCTVLQLERSRKDREEPKEEQLSSSNSSEPDNDNEELDYLCVFEVRKGERKVYAQFLLHGCLVSPSKNLRKSKVRLHSFPLWNHVQFFILCYFPFVVIKMNSIVVLYQFVYRGYQDQKALRILFCPHAQVPFFIYRFLHILVDSLSKLKFNGKCVVDQRLFLFCNLLVFLSPTLTL